MTLEFTFSEQTEALDDALAKVQGEIEAASKDSTNPQFAGRKYADLTSVWDACRAPLTKNGINVTQWPVHSDDDRLHIVTRVAHKGQWMMAHFSMPVTQKTPQGYGSATTYAKRYTLSAALGIVADDDDDGNAASAGKQQTQSKPPQEAPTRVDPVRDKAISDKIKAALDLCETEEDVRSTMRKNAEALDSIPDGKAIKTRARTMIDKFNSAKVSAA